MYFWYYLIITSFNLTKIWTNEQKIVENLKKIEITNFFVQKLRNSNAKKRLRNVKVKPKPNYLLLLLRPLWYYDVT